MRKFAISMCAFLCLPFMAMAQSTENVATRGTIYGGYSLLHTSNSLGTGLGSGLGSDLGGSLGSSFGGNNFNGWDGQGTFNFARHFGVTADFSGNSKQLAGISFLGFSAGTQQHMYNVLFGPTATAYFGKSSVFGHALFGVAHSSLSAGVSAPILGGISAPLTSANSFAMAFGGGVDIGLSKHFAIRAAQIDFIRTNFNSANALASGLPTSLNNNQNSFRYSGGIVFRF
jgi:opacity protein-like surface antigen